MEIGNLFDVFKKLNARKSMKLNSINLTLPCQFYPKHIVIGLNYPETGRKKLIFLSKRKKDFRKKGSVCNSDLSSDAQQVTEPFNEFLWKLQCEVFASKSMKLNLMIINFMIINSCQNLHQHMINFVPRRFF